MVQFFEVIHGIFECHIRERDFGVIFQRLLDSFFIRAVATEIDGRPLSASFGQCLPDFGIRESNRRFIGERNVCQFDLVQCFEDLVRSTSSPTDARLPNQIGLPPRFLLRGEG